MKYVLLALYGLCIPFANWLMVNVGWNLGGGPLVIPVGWGLMAPSGVMAIGAALYLRDEVQEQFGVRIATGAIALGMVLTWLTSAPELAFASAMAYVFSEALDFAVYTPLKNRKLHSLAVLASGTVGSVIDSVLFLYLAFGSLEYVAGQIAAKVELTILFSAIAWIRNNDLLFRGNKQKD